MFSTFPPIFSLSPAFFLFPQFVPSLCNYFAFPIQLLRKLRVKYSSTKQSFRLNQSLFFTIRSIQMSVLQVFYTSKAKVNPQAHHRTKKPKSKPFLSKKQQKSKNQNRPRTIFPSVSTKSHFSKPPKEKTCHDLIHQYYPKWIFPQNPFPFSFIL